MYEVLQVTSTQSSQIHRCQCIYKSNKSQSPVSVSFIIIIIIRPLTHFSILSTNIKRKIPFFKNILFFNDY